MTDPTIRAALEWLDNPKEIYLSPQCCTDPLEGRHWCRDDVWPCLDCPHRQDHHPPRGVRYIRAADQAAKEGEP